MTRIESSVESNLVTLARQLEARAATRFQRTTEALLRGDPIPGDDEFGQILARLLRPALAQRPIRTREQGVEDFLGTPLQSFHTYKLEILDAALRRNSWNVKKTAAELQIGRATVYRWLRASKSSSPHLVTSEPQQ